MKLVDKIKKSNFDFVHHGRWFFITPAIILLVGIIFFCIFGFNLGLEFTGGTIVTVNADGAFDQAAIVQQMDTYQQKYGDIKAEVHLEKSSEGNVYAIKFNAGENDEAIISDLQQNFFGDEWISADSIQASTSKEKIRSIFWSIFAALVGLIIYMLFRFKFTAGIATVLALAHDVLMICALVVIFQVEINTSFIAAILTVMAYSINNSLVVFDRVRNLEKNNVENYTLNQILNVSLRRTLVRCILTVTTTLATLLTLTIISIFMNLTTLIQFALPIIFGLFAGTYSSLFLIAPMYYQFELPRMVAKKRKNAYLK